MNYENTTVLILHEGKKPAGFITDALSGSQWKIASATVHGEDFFQQIPLIDCVVIELDGGEKHDAAKFVNRIRQHDDNLPVVVVAGSKSPEEAVSAMKAGAYDYFTEPFDSEKLKNAVGRAIHLFGLTKRVYLLENQVGWRDSFDNIIGQSQSMQEIYGMISMVAKTQATVLITGESGTGKELVAQAIHRHSQRAKKAFIDINCGAIPRELLENELFGHERGAYTGADKRYIGSCERAEGGALFLDEISEMDPLLQVKLLRFLQERSFNRVGGDEVVRVDVRIITATNRDIVNEVNEGRFREDLYYRLNVVPIHIPPLRERREDIALLAKHFLEKYSTKNEKIFLDIAPQALEMLASYDWPGNVRELENTIERVVVLGNDSRVKPKHLPAQIKNARSRFSGASPVSDFQPVSHDPHKILPLDLVEKYAIEAALKKCAGNVTETARKLKLGPATLYRKIKQYGLK